MITLREFKRLGEETCCKVFYDKDEKAWRLAYPHALFNIGGPTDVLVNSVIMDFNTKDKYDKSIYLYEQVLIANDSLLLGKNQAPYYYMVNKYSNDEGRFHFDKTFDDFKEIIIDTIATSKNFYANLKLNKISEDFQ